MAPKTKAKAKTASRPVQQNVSVNISSAKNGYVVNSYTDKGSTTMIAKTSKEAQGHAAKLLKGR